MNRIARTPISLIALVLLPATWSLPAGAAVYATADIQYVSGSVVGTCTSVSTSPNDEQLFWSWSIYCGMDNFAQFNDSDYRNGAFYGGYNESVQIIDSSPVSSQYTVNGDHTWYGYSNEYDYSWVAEYCTVFSSTSGICS